MEQKINKNLRYLMQRFHKMDKRGALLEGSSRSGKTISSIDAIIYLGARIGSGNTINVYRETYNSFKTTLYNDFSMRLDDFGLQNPFLESKEVPTLRILGNKVNLIGADKINKSHGLGGDYSYFNEMTDISQDFFDQIEMRTKKFWWGDYNPKVTSHWLYDKVATRDDVGFLHSTFRDNPFIADVELAKILSYEDTPDNRRQGTVDVYKWKVYGLGLRAAMEGLIFPNVIWIDEFPDDCEEESYGLDFGYTVDPSALVRAGVKGRNLFLELKLYAPTETPDVLGELLSKLLPEDAVCWADSADPDMIRNLKAMGFPIYAIRKPNGSVKFGCSLIKRYKIHIVRSSEFRIEQENYKRKVIQGITLDEPIDKFNHAWDASRYAVMGSFTYHLPIG